MPAIGVISLAVLGLGGLMAGVASGDGPEPGAPGAAAISPGGALDGHRPRVVVSTDIGGTDPDDFQSMVHLLVYADVLDLEGLISSPPGPGRKEDILKVIDCYARDFANLRTHSDRYPTPEALAAMTRQGETEAAPYAGVRRTTEGSSWLVGCARRADPRPLHVLVWGGIEDLAQALHDAPDIRPRLRVYWIGGPNKKWSPDAYRYVATRHPGLWIIEANATYRGWFTGGNQSGGWGNQEFVTRHVAGQGALGTFFAAQLGGRLKMGDSPSVGWLLRGTPTDPSQPGWGGQFVRAWERPYVRLDRLPTPADRIEVFGILELVLPLGDQAPARPEVWLEVENQSLPAYAPGDGTLRFRFCPKAATICSFRIHGNVPELDGQTGAITAVASPPDRASYASADHPHWWTDDPAPALLEGGHLGVRTVSRWREAFLGDFASRMRRCGAPQAGALRGSPPPDSDAGKAARPSPRTDENSRLAHAQLVEKARRGGIDVYFVGDSITRRWGASDYPDFLEHWNRSFFGWNAANFGWGADRIENILWRLENGELDGVHPKVIVILAGANNLGRQPPDDPMVSDIARGIEALVTLCRKKAPQATIILTAMFPRNDTPGLMPVIQRINASIARLADGGRVRFLNVNDRLAGPDGRLFDGVTVDGLHPSLKGYQVWADGLKPLLTELLGPPGKTDHAPPPTGDPSAATPPRQDAPATGTGGR